MALAKIVIHWKNSSNNIANDLSEADFVLIPLSTG
jgi:hypothetical protein